MSSFYRSALVCIPGIYEHQFICISDGKQSLITAEDNAKKKY